MKVFAKIYMNAVPASLKNKIQPLLRDYLFRYILKLKGGMIKAKHYTMFVDSNDRKGLINYGNYLLSGDVDIEKHCIDILMKSVEINDKVIFIDVGANYGMYTLSVCAKHSPSILKVISIEPSESVAGLLLKSVNHNGFSSDVNVYNAAIGDAHNGSCRYVQHKSQSSYNYTSYNENFTIDSDEYIPGPEVNTVTIDGILNDLNLTNNNNLIVKIDIEGNEILALKGMREAFAGCAGYQVLLEFSTNRMKIAGNDPESLIDKIFDIGPDYVFHLNDKENTSVRVDSKEYFNFKVPACMNVFFGKNMSSPI